jgi:S-methylmethionine-dependent homocysteine/selenocysteine methylase
VLLLDGATGSELDRRGVNVSRGAAESQPGAWSAAANIDAPEIVRQVHEDYLRLGVDIVTSNNFWTCRTQLATIGQGTSWERYARAAGEIALHARDAANPEAYVAAGIALPPGGRGDPFSETRDQARLLASVGVDLVLAESISDIAEAVLMTDACADTGLPVFLGIRSVRSDGRMRSGESFEKLIESLGNRPVGAILLMCSEPENISAGLPALRSAWNGPIGAYANIGYGTNPEFGVGTQAERYYRFVQQSGDMTPERYAQFADDWLTRGAQIIGGCCATGPEHIAAVAKVIRGEP